VLERGDRGEHPLALGGQPQTAGAQALGQWLVPRRWGVGGRVRSGHVVERRSVSDVPMSAETPGRDMVREAEGPSEPDPRVVPADRSCDVPYGAVIRAV
jgi:hypothetical protein